MQKGQARVNARRRAEARVNARKVVGMSAERSSAHKCAETHGSAQRRPEGGRDECRKVNQS